jgi:hypothetical protein
VGGGGGVGGGKAKRYFSCKIDLNDHL